MAAAALMLLAEGAAVACSCFGNGSVDTFRAIATEAAIVAEFELVEEVDFSAKRGALVRPVRTIIGKPQRSYRLEYSEDDPCGSAFRKGWIAVLYRGDVERYDDRGMRLQPDLAHELGEALKARDHKGLAHVRSAVAARRLDAPVAEYEDSGICLQLLLKDAGAVELLRREVARVGRKVPR